MTIWDTREGVPQHREMSLQGLISRAQARLRQAFLARRQSNTPTARATAPQCDIGVELHRSASATRWLPFTFSTNDLR
jgi:hypothetical protein